MQCKKNQNWCFLPFGEFSQPCILHWLFVLHPALCNVGDFIYFTFIEILLHFQICINFATLAAKCVSVCSFLQEIVCEFTHKGMLSKFGCAAYMVPESSAEDTCMLTECVTEERRFQSVSKINMERFISHFAGPYSHLLHLHPWPQTSCILTRWVEAQWKGKGWRKGETDKQRGVEVGGREK